MFTVKFYHLLKHFHIVYHRTLYKFNITYSCMYPNNFYDFCNGYKDFPYEEHTFV